jgi:hypothetical protein
LAKVDIELRVTLLVVDRSGALPIGDPTGFESLIEVTGLYGPGTIWSAMIKG